MQIRDVVESDIDQITAIYNDILTHSTAIYNDVPAAREDRLAWWHGRTQQGYPVIGRGGRSGTGRCDFR